MWQKDRIDAVREEKKLFDVTLWGTEVEKWQIRPKTSESTHNNVNRTVSLSAVSLSALQPCTNEKKKIVKKCLDGI